MSFLRWSQMRKVRKFKQKRDIEGLSRILQCGHLPEVEIAAIQAIEEIGDPRGAVPLVEGLWFSRGDKEWREAALKALSTMGEEGARIVVSQVREGSCGNRDDLAEALIRMGKEAVGPITEALKNIEDEEWWSVDCLVTVLARIGDPRGAESVVARLDPRIGIVVRMDPNMGKLDVVWKAVELFPIELTVGPLVERLRRGSLGPVSLLAIPQAVPLLIEVLQDPAVSTEAKINAVKLLAEISDSRAAAPLVALLRHSRECLLWTTQEALERIGLPAVQALVVALKDPNIQLRRHAANLLVKIPGEAAVVPLIEALEDQDGEVRASAATALGVIGDSRAVRPLLRLLPTKNPALDWWDPWVQIPLIWIGKSAVPDLISELQNWPSGSKTWLEILYILRRIGDSSAIKPLKDILAHEKSESACLEIAEVLDEIA